MEFESFQKISNEALETNEALEKKQLVYFLRIMPYKSALHTKSWQDCQQSPSNLSYWPEVGRLPLSVSQ